MSLPPYEHSWLKYMPEYKSMYCLKLQGKKGEDERDALIESINEDIRRYKMDVIGGDPTGEAAHRAMALNEIMKECAPTKGGKRRIRRHSKKRRTQKRGKTRIHAALNTFVRKGNRLDRDVSTRF
jgi:hypothetical protein